MNALATPAAVATNPPRAAYRPPTREDILAQCIAADAQWAEKPGRNLVLLFDGTTERALAEADVAVAPPGRFVWVDAARLDQRRVREITGESFSSLRMRSLVDSLRSTHGNRYLVLDGPPVLKSPDARILSDLADLVVLVAGYGRVTTEQIEKAAANFEPEKLAGVVFNDIQ